MVIREPHGFTGGLGTGQGESRSGSALISDLARILLQLIFLMTSEDASTLCSTAFAGLFPASNPLLAPVLCLKIPPELKNSRLLLILQEFVQHVLSSILDLEHQLVFHLLNFPF